MKRTKFYSNMKIRVREVRTFKVPAILEADLKAAIAANDKDVINETIGDLDDRGCLSSVKTEKVEVVQRGVKSKQLVLSLSEEEAVTVFGALIEYAARADRAGNRAECAIAYEVAERINGRRSAAEEFEAAKEEVV